MKIMISLFLLTNLIVAKKVTFDEAINLTITNNKELKAKEFETKKAEQSLKEAKAYDYGRLDFAYNISRTNHAGYVFGMKLASKEATFGDFGFGHFIDNMGGLMNPITASQTKSDLLSYKPDQLNNPDARNNFEGKLTYDVPIYTGGKINTAKSMATLQISAKKSLLEYDKKKIAIEVLKAYNGAATAKNFISMLQNSLKITDRFVGTSQRLYNNQLARIIDVKQSQMARQTIRVKLQEAKAKFDVAIAYLKFLTDDKTITDVSKLVFYDRDTSTYELLKVNAIESRDDYNYMKLNTKTMKKKIALDGASSYPTIGAHLEYGLNDNTPTVDTDKDYYLGAIGLRYTIFDGDINNINKQKAKIEYMKTKTYFDYMKSGIELEVNKYYLDFKANKAQIPNKIKIENMAKDILRRTENVYNNNLNFRVNMMFLLMQFENLLKSQADLIKSKYDQTILYGKLQISSGKSLRSIK